MQVYLPGTAVIFSIPLVDQYGNALSVSAIQYRVVDQTGAEVLALQPLTSFVPGSAVALVTIPAINNALIGGMIRDLREVDLTLTVSGNTVALASSYIIGATDPLQVGLNSFITYAQAQFAAQNMANLDSWNAATEQMRVAALVEARTHIVRLSFTPLNSNVNWGQDSLNYIPEGVYETGYLGNASMFLFNGNLDLLQPAQFPSLPPRFLDALKRAQIAEADYILGGNSIDQKRHDGLVQDNIGESRQTYRASKPLNLPVCTRALGYLAYFISFSKRLGRM